MKPRYGPQSENQVGYRQITKLFDFPLGFQWPSRFTLLNRRDRAGTQGFLRVRFGTLGNVWGPARSWGEVGEVEGMRTRSDSVERDLGTTLGSEGGGGNSNTASSAGLTSGGDNRKNNSASLKTLGLKNNSSCEAGLVCAESDTKDGKKDCVDNINNANASSARCAACPNVSAHDPNVSASASLSGNAGANPNLLGGAPRAVPGNPTLKCRGKLHCSHAS
jgi:hypothetical protein